MLLGFFFYSRKAKMLEDGTSQSGLETRRMKYPGGPAVYGQFDDLFDPTTTSTMWKDRINPNGTGAASTVIAVRGPNPPYQAVDNPSSSIYQAVDNPAYF